LFSIEKEMKRLCIFLNLTVISYLPVISETAVVFEYRGVEFP
jgi:hypothetical protein